MFTGRLGGLRRLRRLASQTELDGDSEQELIQGLTCASQTWRLIALQGLVRHESSAAVSGAERLLEMKTETDPFLVASCRLVLAGAGKGDADDLAERALGRRGLVHEGMWPTRPQLARRTGEGWPLRRLAIQALGALGGRRDALRWAATSDPDWAVREEAVRALGAPIDEGDDEALEQARQDDWLPVRVAAAEALGKDPEPAREPDERYAWRVAGWEPYFRYLCGNGRQEYADELVVGTRNGPGRNWSTFGILCDLDMGDQPPGDVNSRWSLVRSLGVDSAMTQARDLLHHPAIAWGEEPSWPVCCHDYSVFYGHNLASACPPALDIETWFLESLVIEMPLPDCSFEDLEADTYAFRCGFCGSWWTTYVPDL